LKILIVNFNIGGYAGDSGQLMNLAKGLKKIGHDVTFVTTDANIFSHDKEQTKQYNQIRKQLQEANEKIITVDNVSVLPIHTTISKLGLFCPNASNIGKKIIPQYDIVHVFNWYYHLAVIFTKIAHKNKIPFIYSAAGGLQEKAKELKKRQKWVVDKLFTNKMIQNSTILHSVGDLETKSYINSGAPLKKIVRIDHGINLNDFIIKKESGIIEKLGLKDQSFMLFLSRINKKKGIELLINSYKKIRSNHKISLVIAGSGEEKYVKELKKLVLKLGLENNIKFTGYVTEDEKLQLLDECIFFILTSHSDVHPIAVQDALAMGAPVIVTKECDYPEVSEYNAGFEVDPTIESISEAIEKILSNKSKIQTLSKNAKKLTHEKSLMEVKIKEYEKMYKKAIEINQM
jgi:glycosyltransferase involved in cell wall biosynthesis